MNFPWERFGYHIVYDRDIFDAISFAEAHGFGYIVPDLMISRFWLARGLVSRVVWFFYVLLGRRRRLLSPPDP